VIDPARKEKPPGRPEGRARTADLSHDQENGLGLPQNKKNFKMICVFPLNIGE
jgi:hypothetical protein